MSETYFNWEPVIRSFLRRCQLEGLKLISVDDGEEVFVVPETVHFYEARSICTEAIDSVNESWLRVRDETGKTGVIYIVLGNSPEEIVVDYSCGIPGIEEAAYSFYLNWENRIVPEISREVYLQKQERYRAIRRAREIASKE